MVTLTNVGSTYDAIPASQGLGMALLDFTGITQITFAVRANKIGTGTQSWQLWNETDGAEIAVIADAGPTGIKPLTPVTVLVNLSGVKSIRVRAKSTNGADDPVFLGASVLPA